MDSTTSVPDDHISIYDPEPRARHDVKNARPNNDKLVFARFPPNLPSVTVDIDHKDHAHSYATVFAVKIHNDNLETVNIYKKETDDTKEWTKVYTGDIPTDGTIWLPKGEQMGMIKIEPATGSPTKDNEFFIFNFDIAVCEYGFGK